MIRRILFVLLTAGLIAAIVYGYLSVRQVQQPFSDPLRAIPPKSALVIEGNDFADTWTRVSSGNIIWEALKSTEYFRELHTDMQVVDSLYRNNKNLHTTLEGHPIYVAAVMTGSKSYHFLFVFGLPANYDPAFVHQLFEVGEHKPILKTYDNAEVRTVQIREGRDFTYTLHENLVIGSFSNALVGDAIRQVNSGISLGDDPAFKRIKATSGANNAVNLLINQQTLPSLLGTYLNSEGKALMAPTNNFSTWTELDLKIKSNYLMLNGFSLAPDSLNPYLSLFASQKPQDLDATGVMSHQTAAFVHFGFSNYNAFQKDFQEYLDSQNKLLSYAAYIQQINTQYECDLIENLFSWLEYEVAIYITEPSSADFEQQSFVLLRTRDPGAAKGNLNDLATRVALSQDKAPFFVEYRGYEMRKLNIDDLFPKLFGPLFGKMEQNYYTFIDQYVLFANTPSALRDAINDYLSNRTLSEDINYSEFQDNLSGESNILVYSNIARSPYFYQAFANEKVAEDIDLQLELFRQFEAIAIQISSDRKNMYYNNIFLKYNPVYKLETKSLWEARLDSSVSRKPSLVTNHYTKAEEVLVQDDGDAVYLISNTGRILWKVQLDGPIVGDVNQIDIFRNNKLQMLFNTKDKLYLLDRNGRHVDGFPVELPKPASAGHAAMDYDRTKEYRILVPTEDGKLLNFDRFGKRVKGWSFRKGRSPICRPMRHFSMAGKDYIIGIEERGNVHVLNRKGETRLNIAEKLPISKHNDYFLELGSTLAQTYLVATDSAGNVLKLNLEGDLENIHVGDFSPDHYFFYTDLNNDQSREFLFADTNQFSVFESDKSQLFEQVMETPVSAPIQLFNFPGNVKEIGLVTKEATEVYLISSQGLVRDKFPLFGSTPFVVGDINKDGTYNLVTGHSDKGVYTYSLTR